jgi:hypothetical protein
MATKQLQGPIRCPTNYPDHTQSGGRGRWVPDPRPRRRPAGPGSETPKSRRPDRGRAGPEGFGIIAPRDNSVTPVTPKGHGHLYWLLVAPCPTARRPPPDTHGQRAGAGSAPRPTTDSGQYGQTHRHPATGDGQRTEGSFTTQLHV